MRDRGIHLRHRMTEPERLLWTRLRTLREQGAKFRRQVPIGDYIVDFACHRSKIVIELDGSQHGESDHANRDIQRDAWLASRDYRVMRFWNRDLWPNSDVIADQIARVVIERLPSP